MQYPAWVSVREQIRMQADKQLNRKQHRVIDFVQHVL